MYMCICKVLCNTKHGHRSFPITLPAGYFDQQFRQILFTKWASHLQQASIQFRADLARVEVNSETNS